MHTAEPAPRRRQQPRCRAPRRFVARRTARLAGLGICAALFAIASGCARPCDDARREAGGALSGYHLDATAAATAGAMVAATGGHQIAGDRAQIEDAPEVARLVEQLQQAVQNEDWAAVAETREAIAALATAPGWDVTDAAVGRAVDVCTGD